MKKLLISLVLSILIAPSAFAQNYKIIAEVMEPFSTEAPSTYFKAKTVQDYFFNNNEKLEQGSIITTKVTKIIHAKRAKRDAYFYVKLTKLQIPSLNKTIKIENKNAIAKITRYKEFDKGKAAYSAGVSVAGLFVDNIAYPVNFIKGMMSPDEDSNRLKSGFKTMYKNSSLSYIEKGEDMILQRGDIIILNIKNQDE